MDKQEKDARKRLIQKHKYQKALIKARKWRSMIAVKILKENQR